MEIRGERRIYKETGRDIVTDLVGEERERGRERWERNGKRGRKREDVIICTICIDFSVDIYF